MRCDTLVSVVAPLQDDGPVLRAFVADAVAVLGEHYADYELVLVDDGSTDGTIVVVEELLRSYACLRLIRLSRRFGADVAITAGLDAAIGDYVAVMRPQSDPPGEIPAMVRAARRGTAASCWGPRRARRGAGPWCGWGAWPSSGRSAGCCPPPPRPTRPASASCPARPVNAITRIKSKYRHVGFLSCAVGSAAAPHPYEQIARSPRRIIRPLREAVDEAISLLVTNSFIPLRVASYVGTFAGFLNLAYVVYILLVNLVKRQVAEGWTTLSLQISAMFFFVFLNLAIISEYVAHLMQEALDRPLYHVLDERASTVRVTDPERRNVA
jgi:glycosyltransferase involved in cell wall biosynthesis